MLKPAPDLSNRQLDAIAVQADRKRLFVLYDELEADASKSWLVDKMLGAGELSAFYGPPGCGKSVIVEDMALHIAAGIQWHGKPVTRGAVVYVVLERKKLVERRAIAWRLKHDRPGLPFAIVGGVYDFRQAATAQQIGDICRQVEQKTGEEVVLIIVDTVSRALAGGDENSPKDMGTLVTTLALLHERTKAHILLVHHIPHDSDRLRGHGALLAAVDTTVAVANSGSVRTAKVVKANDSEEGEGVTFTIDGIEIAPDGTTAAVALPSDRPASNPTPKQKLPARAKLCLAALTETLITFGEVPPPSLGLSGGLKVVTFQAWRDELCSRGLLNPDDKNYWRDFGRIREQLASREIIAVRDGFAWLCSG